MVRNISNGRVILSSFHWCHERFAPSADSRQVVTMLQKRGKNSTAGSGISTFMPKSSVYDISTKQTQIGHRDATIASHSTNTPSYNNNSSSNKSSNNNNSNYNNKNSNNNSSSNNNNKDILSEKKIVIILTYMRTGSSFTGSVFQEYPNSFYVFEPLRSITNQFGFLTEKRAANATLTYADGKTRSYPVAELERAHLDEINNWLTCKLNALSWNTLTDDFHSRYTKYMKKFYHCITRIILSAIDLAEDSQFEFTLPRIPNKLNLSKDINKCFETTINACKRASVIVLKFIRLKMETIEKLLPLYPNMKIIHLVRDPRGISNSRVNLPFFSSVNRHLDTQNLCNTMWENVLHSKSILERYPDTLKVTYYEEIAEAPAKTVKEMVEFTGLNFNARMLKYVENKTISAKAKDKCVMCLERTDSRKTAVNWRRELSFNFSQFVFNTCKETNNLLGFLPFSSEVSQLDLTIPSRKSVDVNNRLRKHSIF